MSDEIYNNSRKRGDVIRRDCPVIKPRRSDGITECDAVLFVSGVHLGLCSRRDFAFDAKFAVSPHRAVHGDLNVLERVIAGGGLSRSAAGEGQWRDRSSEGQRPGQNQRLKFHAVNLIAENPLTSDFIGMINTLHSHNGRDQRPRRENLSV